MIGDRIKQIINELFKGNVSNFSLKTGIPQGQMANYVGGRFSKPSVEVIEKIVTSIDIINTDWLVTGRGEMLLEKIEKVEKEGEKIEIIQYLERKLKEKDQRIEEVSVKLGEKTAENKILHELLMKKNKGYHVSVAAEKEETYTVKCHDENK